MKKQILLIMLILSLPMNLLAQTCGWMDLSDNIPSVNEIAPLLDVDVIGDEVWITSSGENRIYYSDGGGSTEFSYIETPFEPYSIYMLTPLVGYCGSDGAVYRTNDGWQTWGLLFPLAGSWVTCIDFPSNSEPGFLSTLGGNTYLVDSTGLTEVPIDVSVSLYSICFPESSDLGWVCGEDILFQFIDSVWIGRGTPLWGVSGVCFIDNLNGWVVGYDLQGNGQIAHTSNGLNFTLQTDPNPELACLTDVAFCDDGLNGWAIGNRGKILHTTNGGETWVQEAEDISERLLNDIVAVDEHTAYIAGGYNTFLKYGELTSVDYKQPLPSRVSLHQNYPNPFNATTSIRFELPEQMDVTLLIYNLLGVKVATLANDSYPAGGHIINWDASPYASGIYFYKLDTGDYTETKKMLLIK